MGIIIYKKRQKLNAFKNFRSALSDFVYTKSICTICAILHILHRPTTKFWRFLPTWVWHYLWLELPWQFSATFFSRKYFIRKLFNIERHTLFNIIHWHYYLRVFILSKTIFILTDGSVPLGNRLNSLPQGDERSFVSDPCLSGCFAWRSSNHISWWDWCDWEQSKEQ